MLTLFRLIPPHIQGRIQIIDLRGVKLDYYSKFNEGPNKITYKKIMKISITYIKIQ